MNNSLIALIFLLPVTITAITQIYVAKRNIFPKLAIPIDGGKKIGSNFIFGETKTWRGFIFMTITTPLVSIIIYPLFPPFSEISNNIARNFLIGVFCGIGYSLGELPNSFIKRRLSIPSGKVPSRLIGRIMVVIGDSIDSAIGIFLLFLPTGLVFTYWEIAFNAFWLGGLIHVLVNFILWTLGVKRYWT